MADVSVNPMLAQGTPMQQALMEHLMLLLGGLGQTVPMQPQPQQAQMQAILGGLGGPQK